jgi:hypothetical protein
VEIKWKNYHITTFPGQSLSNKNMRDASPGEKLKIALFGEEAMDLLRDRQILELERATIFGTGMFRFTKHPPRMDKLLNAE